MHEYPFKHVLNHSQLHTAPLGSATKAGGGGNRSEFLSPP
jgi:hypothetical protein